MIFLTAERQIDIGSLGPQVFQEGFYTYTGSAYGKGSLSLGGRIQRHLRQDKKKRWQIDYLLSANNTKIQTVIAAHTTNKKECEINCPLRYVLGAEVAVKGFGSSDCKRKCGSHLLYGGPNDNFIDSIDGVYSEKVNGEIHILNFH